jgi:hypothetical protein
MNTIHSNYGVYIVVSIPAGPEVDANEPTFFDLILKKGGLDTCGTRKLSMT